MQEINLFQELFLSTQMWGYFGPLALVVFGYILTRKEKPVGILFFVIDCLCAAQYLELVEATPDYWWQILILVLGGVICLIPALMDR